MFSILSIAILSDFMIASPEPMSIMLWGIVLILFSIKLRSGKADLSRQGFDRVAIDAR
jgi:hypothetical protein